MAFVGSDAADTLKDKDTGSPEVLQVAEPPSPKSPVPIITPPKSWMSIEPRSSEKEPEPTPLDDLEDSIADMLEPSPKTPEPKIDCKVEDAKKRLVTREAVEARIIHLAKQAYHLHERKFVEKDGNCLFRAIGRQTIGEDYHKSIRRDAVEEVELHEDLYRDFFLDGDAGILEWVAEMQKDFFWGDGIAVRAACNDFSRPVMVFRTGSTQDPSVFLPEEWTAWWERPIMLELDETSRNNEHYWSLESDTVGDGYWSWSTDWLEDVRSNDLRGFIVEKAEVVEKEGVFEDEEVVKTLQFPRKRLSKKSDAAGTGFPITFGRRGAIFFSDTVEMFDIEGNEEEAPLEIVTKPRLQKNTKKTTQQEQENA